MMSRVCVTGERQLRIISVVEQVFGNAAADIWNGASVLVDGRLRLVTSRYFDPMTQAEGIALIPLISRLRD